MTGNPHPNPPPLAGEGDRLGRIMGLAPISNEATCFVDAQTRPLLRKRGRVGVGADTPRGARR
jgi:hypothetical protein